MPTFSTIDELIAGLLALKAEHGGDCAVKISTGGPYLSRGALSLARVGKADPGKTVSRGGDPCVVIGTR